MKSARYFAFLIAAGMVVGTFAQQPPQLLPDFASLRDTPLVLATDAPPAAGSLLPYRVAEALDEDRLAPAPPAMLPAADPSTVALSADITQAMPVVSVETTGPTHVNVGQTVTYCVTLKNLGQTTAEQVRLRVVVPRAIRVYEASIQPQRDADGALTFDTGDLPPKSDRQVRIDLVPTETGSLQLGTTVQFTTSLQSTLQVQLPVLKLTCEYPEQVVLGEPVAIQLTVSNIGKVPAAEVVLEPEFPLQWLENERLLPRKLGTLSPGESRVVDVVVKAEHADAPELQFKAHDGRGTEVRTGAVVRVSRSTLDARIIGPAVTSLQHEDVYEMHVTNTGSEPVEDIDVACLLAAGLQVTVLGTPADFDRRRNSLTSHIEQLPPKVTDILRFKAKAVQAGPQTQRLIARSADGAVADRETTTRVQTRDNVHLTLVNLTGPAEVNDVVSVKVLLTNTGTRVSGETQVTIQLPGGLRALASQSQSYTIDDQNVIHFPAFDLDPGDTRSMSFQVTSPSAGQLRVRAAVQNLQMPDPIVAEGDVYFFDGEAD